MTRLISLFIAVFLVVGHSEAKTPQKVGLIRTVQYSDSRIFETHLGRGEVSTSTKIYFAGRMMLEASNAKARRSIVYRLPRGSINKTSSNRLDTDIFGNMTGVAVSYGPSHNVLAPLAEATVYQYGGPEFRTRCIAYDIDIQYVIKTCTQWATDFYQHGLYVQMLGPPDMDPHQVEDIKNACFASGVVGTAAAVIVTQGVSAGLDALFAALLDRLPTMEAGFRSCIQTTQTLGQLVVPSFRLEVVPRHFW